MRSPAATPTRARAACGIPAPPPTAAGARSALTTHANATAVPNPPTANG